HTDHRGTGARRHARADPRRTRRAAPTPMGGRVHRRPAGTAGSRRGSADPDGHRDEGRTDEGRHRNRRGGGRRARGRCPRGPGRRAGRDTRAAGGGRTVCGRGEDGRTMTAVTLTDRRVERQRPHPFRFRLHRAGICNVWQYGDQVFQFEDGRLLLRGKNGAGKSKALELLLPFLLDGDVKRLDATGAGRTTFRWLMSEGATGVNRQGFLWLELRRADEDGAVRYLTLGAVVRWSSSTAEARLTYFVTPARVGVDVALVVDGQPVPLDRLRDKLGDGALITSAREYRARVGREAFGINDPGRYRNLVHLLYRLRRPTIGDRIEAGQLASELGEALPPLDDEVLDTVAHNLDDLETVREDLGRLERTHGALSEL